MKEKIKNNCGREYHNYTKKLYSREETLDDPTPPLNIHPAPRQYWRDGKPSFWLYFWDDCNAVPHAFSFSKASEIRQSCQGTREEAMNFLDSQGLLNDGLIKIRFDLGGEVA